MSDDTWVPEDSAGPATAVKAQPADGGWIEEQPQSWGDWLKSDSIAKGAADFARSAASSIPLWDRVRAIPEVIGGKPYSQAVNEQVAETQAARGRLGPFMASTSDIAGGSALGTGLVKGGITMLGRDVAAPLWRKIATSAAEAGLHGGVQGASHTYSENLPDYIKNAGGGAAVGTTLGAALPAVGGGASALYKAVSDKFSKIPVPVLKAGATDAAGLQNLPQLGPDAMLLDAGPSMLATAQGASQGVGPARSGIIQALTDREAGTVPRLQADLRATLGPAPRVSQVEQGIDAGRQAINANDYRPALQGAQINPQAAIKVISDLNTLGKTSRVDMSEATKALTLPGSGTLPDLSAQSWMNARQNVDSQISVARRAGDNYRVSRLMDARNMIDGELANVPGLKAADAKFAANRAELEALTQGQTLLDKGKNAVHPEDLRDIMTAAPPVVNTRLRQGAHADLDRRLGTEANDLTQLKRTLGTPEDYNAQKASLLFGPQAKAAIDASIERNAAFRRAHQEIVGGPNTAQKLSAREELNVKPLTAESGGTLYGDIKRATLGAVNKIRNISAEQRRDEIARLMMQRNPAQVTALRNAILQQNANTARVGPLVDKYTRGAAQGGVAAGVAPFFSDWEQY
jgi:hypothetical protein